MVLKISSFPNGTKIDFVSPHIRPFIYEYGILLSLNGNIITEYYESTLQKNSIVNNVIKEFAIISYLT